MRVFGMGLLELVILALLPIAIALIVRRIAKAKAKGTVGDIGFAVLGFFLPLVGLILFLVWYDKHPPRAKACGKGALVGVIVPIVLSVVAVVIMLVVLPR